MARSQFKVLTIRDAKDHSDMLYSLMESFHTKSAASSLIQGGYSYLRLKNEIEQLRKENSLLQKKLDHIADGTDQFFRALDIMKSAVSS